MAQALPVIAIAFGAYNVIQGLKEGNILQAVLGGIGAFAGFSGLGALSTTQNAVGNVAAGTTMADFGSTINELQALQGTAVADAASAATSGISSTIEPAAQSLAGTEKFFGAQQGPGTGFTQLAGNAPSAGEFVGAGLTPIQPQAGGFAGAGQAGVMAHQLQPATGLLSGAAPQGAPLLSQTNVPFGGSQFIPAPGSYAPQESSFLGGLFGGDNQILGQGGFLQQNPELVKLMSGGLQGYMQQKAYQDYIDEQKRLIAQSRRNMGYAPQWHIPISQRAFT